MARAESATSCSPARRSFMRRRVLSEAQPNGARARNRFYVETAGLCVPRRHARLCVPLPTGQVVLRWSPLGQIHLPRETTLDLNDGLNK